MSEHMKKEPKIIAFCCNWCAYQGVDFAGTLRMQYPANVRIIRVMCSGRVDPSFILEAFEKGADGVLVAGCHPGDCHYLEGDRQAVNRMKFIQQLLQKIGIPRDRFRYEFISGYEGEKFTRVIKKMVEDIKASRGVE